MAGCVDQIEMKSFGPEYRWCYQNDVNNILYYDDPYVIHGIVSYDASEIVLWVKQSIYHRWAHASYTIPNEPPKPTFWQRIRGKKPFYWTLEAALNNGVKIIDGLKGRDGLKMVRRNILADQLDAAKKQLKFREEANRILDEIK